jgi:hypothetical protein
MKKCINNSKCENFLKVGKQYNVKQSETRSECFSVLVTDKKNRIKGEKWFDFKKDRFID